MPAITEQDCSNTLKSCGPYKVLDITMAQFSMAALQEGGLSTHFSLHREPNTTQAVPIHSIFIRPHNSRKDDHPAERTLFLINLPVDSTQQHLERLFRHCGVIESITWRNGKYAHISGQSCHIVFKDAESIDAVLDMKPRKRVWATDASCGLSSNSNFILEFISEHVATRLSLASIKSKVDTEMAVFTENERLEKEEVERIRNMPDADGFVKVTRGKGRRTNTDGNGASVMPLSTEDALNLKPKDHGLVDFYRFQMRESKRTQLADLRKRFEQDKLKIASLKEKRKFTPY